MRADHYSEWTYPESKKNHPSTRQDHEEQHDCTEACGLLLFALRLFARISHSAKAIEPLRQDQEVPQSLFTRPLVEEFIQILSNTFRVSVLGHD